jgi:hypothetical protein
MMPACSNDWQIFTTPCVRYYPLPAPYVPHPSFHLHQSFLHPAVLHLATNVRINHFLRIPIILYQNAAADWPAHNHVHRQFVFPYPCRLLVMAETEPVLCIRNHHTCSSAVPYCLPRYTPL